MAALERRVAAEPVGRIGNAVAVVGAHGGAGATRAAVALARDSGVESWLVDADLAGGDLGPVLGLQGRIGDVGLAAGGIADAGAIAAAARRTPFGWLHEICPRPELAWLLPDGAVRDAVRSAMSIAPLVVVDAGRPVGPSLEPVVDADVVVLAARPSRVDARERARRRLIRAGVEERRILDCVIAATPAERAVALARRSWPPIDVNRDDRLTLMVEARLAAVGPRDRT